MDNSDNKINIHVRSSAAAAVTTTATTDNNNKYWLIIIKISGARAMAGGDLAIEAAAAALNTNG